MAKRIEILEESVVPGSYWTEPTTNPFKEIHVEVLEVKKNGNGVKFVSYKYAFGPRHMTSSLSYFLSKYSKKVERPSQPIRKNPPSSSYSE